MNIKGIILALCTTSAMAQTPAEVYITAGQSNADGREHVEHLPSYLKNGYQHLRYANVTNSANGHFGNHSFGKRYSFCDITHYLIDQLAQSPFYAIKCTLGGTAIDSAANNAKRATWCADSAWLAHNSAYRGNVATGRSLAKALADGFDACVDTTLSHLPQGYTVKAIMWHQGESDRQHASHYYDNLSQLINYLRKRICAKTGRAADSTVPFIIGTVPRHSRQYSAEVEKATRRVAHELPNVYIIDMGDASLMQDKLHLDSAANEQLGRKMYEMLLNLNLHNSY